jgi:hypothetical protein
MLKENERARLLLVRQSEELKRLAGCLQANFQYRLITTKTAPSETERHEMFALYSVLYNTYPLWED